MADAVANTENNVHPDDELEEVETDGKNEEKAGDWEVDVEDFVGQLAPEVRRRILALKKLQLDVTKLEAAFYAEMHQLEEKYAPLYKPIFEKRRLITTGEYEPTDAECDFPEDEDEELAAKVEQLKLEKEKEGGDAVEKVTGIPDFWLKIFRNVDMLEELTEDPDVPILKHLTDIKVELSSQPTMGFKLHFHFAPNEYFKNSVLTKTYEMKCEMDPEDPFSFEGPEIIKCSGCSIDWYPGKNVTVKVVKKKQKHKQRGSVRTVSKTVDARSFFNFFNPPQVVEGEEMEEDVQLRLTTDFEIGQYIRERIVPRAVLFFTGEALEEEDEEDEYDDEDDEDEDEDEEDEKEGGGKTGAPSNRPRKTPQHKGQNPQQQQDCKQQ